LRTPVSPAQCSFSPNCQLIAVPLPLTEKN